ncbi:MAG: hypothetical protein FWB91_05550 [Defluviitaleaceae bacterium]|nr:hypothetical protein [Defluviitaleaceae bacterium]
MKGKRYDMQKLASSGMIDISVSQRFYYNNQEYFDALSDFVKNHNASFSNYTPAFVVNSEEDRAAFLKECFEARAEFVRMGMTALLDELAVMEDAAINKNMEEFADGQVKLTATVQICIKIIEDAALRWVMTIR